MYRWGHQWCHDTCPWCLCKPNVRLGNEKFTKLEFVWGYQYWDICWSNSNVSSSYMWISGKSVGPREPVRRVFKTMFDIITDNPQFGESMIPNHRFYWHQQLFHIILENLRSVRLSNTDLSNNGLFCAFSPDCSKVTIFLLPQEMTLTSKIQHNDNFNEHNNSWRDSDKWNEAKSKWILQTAFR